MCGKARSVVLNRFVVVVLLGCGPVLTATYWFSMSMDSPWPYRERDLVNGVAALCMTVLLAALAVGVVVRRCRGGGAPYVNVLSAMVLAASAVYVGVFGSQFLDLGSTCRDPACWYEIGQIFWWALWLGDWIALGFLAAIAFVGKAQPRDRV